MNDWSVLALEEDPAPGDPTEIQALAARLQREAEYADQHTDRLRKVAANSGDLRMQGDYAPRFQEDLAKLPDQSAELGPAHWNCGKALSKYAERLEQAKTQARIALGRGVQADAQYKAALSQFYALVRDVVPPEGDIWRGLNGETAGGLSQYQPPEIREAAVQIGRYAGQAEQERQAARRMALEAEQSKREAEAACAQAIRTAAPGGTGGAGSLGATGPTVGGQSQATVEELAHNGGVGNSARMGRGSPDGSASDASRPERANEPLPKLTPQERADHWAHLEEVEARSPEDLDHLQRDPDKNGGISEPSKDEARVGLDLREQGRLPDDIQRPTEPDRGEFYSPRTGKYYDIKGVHSDWPPFNNVRDKSQPFRGAYTPANNRRWVTKLSEQIDEKQRVVILDVRNANQAAIDDIKSIVQKNGWEDDVIWYP